MGRFTRFVVLAVAAVSASAMSPTVGAVTWHNAGSTSFTATGNGVMWHVQPDTALACWGSRLTATAPAQTAASTFRITGTLTYTPCMLGGGQYFIQCDAVWTGVTQSGSVTTGVLDETCGATVVGATTPFCHLKGANPGTYTNPSGSTPGRLTLGSGGSWTPTFPYGGSSGCTLFGAAPVTLTERTLGVTGGAPTAFGPLLNRTP